MLQIVQLQDGCYKVSIDYSADDFAIHKEYTFKPCESNADPMDNGEKIRLEFKGE